MKPIFTYKGVGYSYVEIYGVIYTFRVNQIPVYDDMLDNESEKIVEDALQKFESILCEEELKTWKGE